MRFIFILLPMLFTFSANAFWPLNLIGFSSLHEASQEGDIDRVLQFIDKNMDVNLPDDYGWTPLHYASGTHRRDIVEVLIKNGANVRVKTQKGEFSRLSFMQSWTPLHIATGSGDNVIIKMILKAGANPNTRDQYGRSPLYYVPNGYFGTVEILSRAGASLHVQDNEGRTPLHFASGAGSQKVIEELSEGGHSFTGYFIELDRKEVARRLIKNGAYLNVRDKYKKTPLHYASSDGYVHIARVLLEKNADMQARDEYEKRPIDYAKNSEMRNLLLDYELRRAGKQRL